MKYQLIVFDWDGTLHDSADAVVNAVQKAAGELGYKIPEAKTIRHSMGLILQEAIHAYSPELTPKEIDRLVYQIRSNMTEEGLDSALFEGADLTLDQLNERGYWLAIATGKSRTVLNYDLEVLEMREKFVSTHCADESFSKPNPQMLFDVIEKTGVDKDRVLMVGDTTYDMQMAQNAGVDGLAVTYGVHDRALLKEHAPKDFIDDIRQLTDWLLQFE